MTECKNNILSFNFPEVHPHAKCSVEFIRTLRLPDDGKTYPLPPGIGSFPLLHTDDFKQNLSEDMAKRGGVMLPMYQSEALWIKFHGHHSYEHNAVYPMALKIAAGKRSAITGKAWVQSLKEDDYVVIPLQPWIDGFMLSEGIIRQFLAAPLGQGFTVEEQLTNKAEFGGIQIEVIPMKAEEFERRWPKKDLARRAKSARLGFSSTQSYGEDDSLALNESFMAAPACGGPAAASAGGVMRGVTKGISAQSMGMAAGGKMKQEIHKDPYGLEAWDTSDTSRVFVHLLNSLSWEAVTGKKPPTVPMNASLYKRYGYPWYEAYSDAPALGGTYETSQIKSVQEVAKEKGYSILPENHPILVSQVKPVYMPPTPHGVKDGEWLAN